MAVSIGNMATYVSHFGSGTVKEVMICPFLLKDTEHDSINLCSGAAAGCLAILDHFRIYSS